MKTEEEICEGSCEKHTGQVKRVHVYGANGYDWGEFNYCEEAIKEDTLNRKMIVEIIKT